MGGACRESARVLVVGSGCIGRRHIANLRRANVAVHVYSTGRSSWRNQDSSVVVHSDFDVALRAQPHLVIVANPTSLHHATALRALDNEISVLVEKPLAASFADAEQIAASAQAVGRRLLVGYNYRFHPALAVMQKMVKDGKIGEPWSIRSEVGQYLPDWHPDEDYRVSYAARSDMGGGVIRTLSHEIDYVDWLANRAPERLTCVAMRLGKLDVDVEDTACLSIQYPGLLAEIHLDMVQRCHSRRLLVEGTAGSLCWDDMMRTILWRHPGAEDEMVWIGNGSERDESFIEELGAALRSACDRTPDERFGDPLRTMRLIDLSLRSAQSGRAQDWSA